MGRSRQDAQPDLFGSEPVQQYRPDPERVRRRLESILAEARAAASMPWRPVKLSLYREIVPRMCAFLPAEEGAQYSFQFETELKRLEAA
ncbi:MAG: hypothetical protein JSR60_01680 [Proteobacteria bacterium]|nr:hypothetical protein [Pseudomonadota bacterium]